MSNRRIVIIDNDTEDLETLEGNIKQIDPSAVCLSFVFSDEALRALSEEFIHVPDYIFIDVNMSRISGPDCLAYLTQVPRLSAVKIVMFSGVMPPAVGEAFVKLGAAAYFQKPLLDADYRRRLQNIFKLDEVAVS